MNKNNSPKNFLQSSEKSILTFPKEAKNLFLAVSSDGINVNTYKVEINSGKTEKIGQFKLNKSELGPSVFNGRFYKNSVWFSPDGQKAIVQNDKETTMIPEESPYWHAWQLFDLKSGKLTELYRTDLPISAWEYDFKANRIYINQDGITFFYINVDDRKITKIKKTEFPYDVFTNYTSLFAMSSKKTIKYKLNGNFIETTVPLKQEIGELVGIVPGN